VSYGAGDALASVYVYPEYAAALRGTAAARAELRQVADEVEAVRWREHARVALPDTIGRGFVIVGEQPAQSFSEPRRRTLAAIWPADPWFVELRLTWTDLDAPWRPMLDEVMASAARPCVAPSEPPPELDFKTVLTIVPGGGPMTIHRTVFRVEQPGG
jgi:hypothetical protein